MLKWSDARNFSRTFAALSLVVGPLLLLVSVAVSPAFTVAFEEPAAFLDAVAGGRGAHLATAVLFLAGSLILVPGALGTMHLLRGRGVTLGYLGGALVVIGAVASAAFYVINVVTLEMTDRAAEAEQMAALLERIEEGTAGTILLVVFSAGTVLGILLLALALILRRVVPIWSPIALVLAVVVGFFPDNNAASAIEFALVLLGTTALARRIWALSDDEWAAWQPLSDRPP